MFSEMKDTRAMINCVTFTYLNNKDRWSLEEEVRLVKTSQSNKYRAQLKVFCKKHHLHIYTVNGKPSFYKDEDDGYGYYAYFKYQPITKKVYREALANIDDPFFDFKYWGYGRRMIV